MLKRSDICLFTKYTELNGKNQISVCNREREAGYSTMTGLGRAWSAAIFLLRL